MKLASALVRFYFVLHRCSIKFVKLLIKKSESTCFDEYTYWSGVSSLQYLSISHKIVPFNLKDSFQIFDGTLPTSSSVSGWSSSFTSIKQFS